MIIWALPSARAFHCKSSFASLIPGFPLQSLTHTQRHRTLQDATALGGSERHSLRESRGAARERL